MTAHRASSVARVQYCIRLQTTVSEIIAVGATGCVGRLRSDPTRVLKFCVEERTDAVAQLDQEKKIYAIIGHHPLISHVHSIRDLFRILPTRITQRLLQVPSPGASRPGRSASMVSTDGICFQILAFKRHRSRRHFTPQYPSFRK